MDKMKIEALITEIRTLLSDTFSVIDHWFDEAAPARNYHPENGGWNIDQVLEHIALTNHFLLILIEKGKEKALKKAETESIGEALNNYTFHRDQLTEVGKHMSFSWIRPEHMEPKGEKSSGEIRLWLKEQLVQCFAVLDCLKNGEGVLFKTTMTVNNLGKIDVYEYLYFLAQHGQRHITQMQKIKTEYLNNKS